MQQKTGIKFRAAAPESPDERKGEGSSRIKRSHPQTEKKNVRDPRGKGGKLTADVGSHVRKGKKTARILKEGEKTAGGKGKGENTVFVSPKKVFQEKENASSRLRRGSKC